MRLIGIDIGGTKIRALVWNGRRVARVVQCSTPGDLKTFSRKLTALTARLQGRGRLDGVGIGAAGIVEGTRLAASPNIPYIRRFDFRALWPRSIPVRLDNDARCFGRAELSAGAGKGAKAIFALTIGTGIGRACGAKGKIKRIKRLEYPESWEKKYQAVRDEKDDKKLAAFLGIRLQRLVAPYSPDLVVIGGGVSRSERFFRELRAELGRQGLSVPVRKAKLGKDAGAIGAALLCRERRRQRPA
jgi:predicted NBD/HSP70 family sugar kinase